MKGDTLDVRLLAIGTLLCRQFGLWHSGYLGGFLFLLLLGKDYADVL